MASTSKAFQRWERWDKLHANKRGQESFQEFKTFLNGMSTKEQSAACCQMLIGRPSPGDFEKQVLREMSKIQHVVDSDDPENLWVNGRRTKLIGFWMYPVHLFHVYQRDAWIWAVEDRHDLLCFLHLVSIAAKEVSMPITPDTAPHLYGWLDMLFDDFLMPSAFRTLHLVWTQHKSRLRQKAQELLRPVLPNDVVQHILLPFL